MRALDAVAAHLDTVAATSSRPTVRQRAWALNQALDGAALAALHGPVPTRAQVTSTQPDVLAATRARLDAAALLDPTFAAWYLPWAATGALSATERSGTSDASARARTAALRALAAQLGTPPPAHDVPGPTLRAPYPPAAARALARALGEHTPPGPARTRLRALLAVAAAAPARPAQLCALTTAHLHAQEATWTVQSPEIGPATLTGADAAALDAWLAVREALVSALTGTPPDALWVAVRSHMTPEGTVRPAGLPLHPRGLERTFAAAILRLNQDLAAHPEHTPHALHQATGGPGVPVRTSFELWRRSLPVPGGA